MRAAGFLFWKSYGPAACNPQLLSQKGAGWSPENRSAFLPTGIYSYFCHLLFLPRSFAVAQYSGYMSSLFFEEIYCFFLKKCNLNTPPGKSIFLNIFQRSIFLFQRYHYFVIGIQLMFIQ